MSETVKFVLPSPDDGPDFCTCIARDFYGRVKANQLVGDTRVVTVEFDSYDDACNAAWDFDPNDRTYDAFDRDLDSDPDDLSPQPLWSVEEVVQVTERYRERIQATMRQVMRHLKPGQLH